MTTKTGTATRTETVQSADAATFGNAVRFAMMVRPRCDAMLSHDVDYSTHRCYLTDDGTAGFAITPDGDLVSVFNVGRHGRSDILLSAALDRGARTLDCFDGFLPALYRRYGFVEYAREANWTPGEPDVVYMWRILAV